jgi:leucyl aminopeptidase (aminopeptidase T)
MQVAWIDREAITPGVLSMLKVNMGIRDGESLLILTDLPTSEQWIHLLSYDVEVMLRRAYLARLVADLARVHLPACTVRFLTYPSTGRSAVEPPDEVVQAMQTADVVLIITSFSLSHTDAREDACRRGVRVASMPRFIPEMLYRDGPMAVDYRQVAVSTHALAGLITAARRVRIATAAGTDVEFSVEGREGRGDTGMYTAPGSWGNLPAGEAYCALLEGTAQGRLIVEPGWHRGLTEPMTIRLERGEVVALEGGGSVGAEIAEILDMAGRGEATRPRRLLGELGIGTNPQARRTDITVEAEKIKGTVHLAVGDNSHMGGVVMADYHQDFVFPRPDVWFDNEPVIAGGRWVAPVLAAG